MARSISAQSQDNTRRANAGLPPVYHDPSGAGPVGGTGPGGVYNGGAYQTPPSTTSATRPPPTAGAPPPSGGGSPPPTTPYSPHGYGEVWWDQTKGNWAQPTAGDQYWNGVQGYFAPGQNSNEQTISGYGQQLGSGPGQAENMYDAYNYNGAFTNPGDMENWYAQNGQNITSANGGTNALNSAIGGYGQQTDMENWLAQNGSQYGQQGDATSYYQNTVGNLLGNTNLAQHQGGIANDINSAQNTAGFFGATAGDLARPGYAESLANTYVPGQQTYNEQFLNGGGATEGLDQLYNRLYSTGARKLDDASAARGGFNSGASLRAQEELGADLNAQHVKDYMSASNAADQSRNAYQQYGLGLTTAADTGLRGRISTGLTGANMVDTTALNRAKASQDLYSGVSDENRANITEGGVLAQNSGADVLSRLNNYRDAANDSSTQALNRYQGLTTAGNDLATQTLDQYKAAAAAAKDSQSAADTRYNTGMNSAQKAQDEWMNRLMDSATLGQSSQNLEQSRYTAGSNIANSTDTGKTARWAAGQSAADSAEAQQINRENSVFNNLNTLGNEQAGTQGSAMDKIRTEQAAQMADQINGMLTNGKITAEEAQAKYGAQMASLGLVIQGGKVIAGAAAGIPPTSARGGSSAGSFGNAQGPDDTLPINI